MVDKTAAIGVIGTSGGEAFRVMIGQCTSMVLQDILRISVAEEKHTHTKNPTVRDQNGTNSENTYPVCRREETIDLKNTLQSPYIPDHTRCLKNTRGLASLSG
jgi:hypothetical protein